MSQFRDDVKNGTLPPVAFIDADIRENSEGNDEHPPGDIQKGQKFVSDVVHQLFKSPQWKQMAFILTYDEHGGIFDHVVPPPACAPDDVQPDMQTDEDKEFAKDHPGVKFDQYGIRVPVVVVSPFAKKNFVSHHVYDHTSITRFIEATFKVPALTNRDANADAMYDFFDFSNPTFAAPPNLPDAAINQASLAECQARFPAGLFGSRLFPDNNFGANN
jgi:phospholipase C